MGLTRRAGRARGVKREPKMCPPENETKKLVGLTPPLPPLLLSYQTHRVSGLKESSFHSTVAKSVARNVSTCLEGVGGRGGGAGGRRAEGAKERSKTRAPALAKESKRTLGAGALASLAGGAGGPGPVAFLSLTL